MIGSILLGLGAGIGGSYLLWGRTTNHAGAIKLPSKTLSAKLSLLPPAPSTVAELLRTCPTEQEVAEIHRSFSISFASDVNPGNSTNCSAFLDGNASLNLINAFRVMRFLRFKPAIPTINAHSAYDYLAGRGTRYNIANGLQFSSGWNNVINLRYDVVKNPENLTESGILGLIGLILHEGRHAIDGVEHSGCRSDRRLAFDPSLGYGGAYATSYYWKQWLANHAGNKISQEQKDILRFEMEEMMDPSHSVFCDRYSGSAR